MPNNNLNTERPYKASLRISDIEDIRSKAILLDNCLSIFHFERVNAHVRVRIVTCRPCVLLARSVFKRSKMY